MLTNVKKYQRYSAGLTARELLLIDMLGVQMTDNYTLNDGHIHEAIDRINVAINYLQSTLAEHALINAVSEYETKVQAAIEILAALYQEIGRNQHVSDIAKHHKLKAGYIAAGT